MCLFDVHHKLEAHCDGAYVIWSIQRKFSRALNSMTMMMVMIMTMMTMMMMMMMMEMEMQLYPQSPADGVTAPLGDKQLSGLWGKTMMMMMVMMIQLRKTKKSLWIKNYQQLYFVEQKIILHWPPLFEDSYQQKPRNWFNLKIGEHSREGKNADPAANTISKMSMERNLVKKN